MTMGDSTKLTLCKVLHGSSPPTVALEPAGCADLLKPETHEKVCIAAPVSIHSLLPYQPY